MKTRVITSVVSVGVLCAVLVFYDTIYFNLICGVLALIAIREIMVAIKPADSGFLFVGLVPITFVLMCSSYFTSYPLGWLLVGCFFVYCAVLLVFHFEKMAFVKLGGTVFFSGVVLFGFYTFVYFKILFPFENYRYDALFYLILALCIAWGGDIFAFFAGSAFGKHKLAPHVSPKKTIEGAMGGVLGSAGLALLSLWIYLYILPMISPDILVTVKPYACILLVIMAGIGSLLGILGDLFASAVKRQCGIKDYGTLFPGHGGVLDRFDSVLFVAPFVALITGILPIFA